MRPRPGQILRRTLTLPLIVATLFSACQSEPPTEAEQLRDRMFEELRPKAAEELFVEPRQVELAQAIKKGRVDRVRELLEDGVDPNGWGADGATLLKWALVHDQKEAYRLLLEHGADPNQDRSGSEMVMAAVHEDPYFLEQLLEHGGDPNVRDVRRRLPLPMAAQAGRLENARLLLEAGADPNGFNGFANATALYEATAGGHAEVIELLLEHGADPDFSPGFAVTAREAAECSADPDIRRLFDLPPLEPQRESLQ